LEKRESQMDEESPSILILSGESPKVKASLAARGKAISSAGVGEKSEAVVAVASSYLAKPGAREGGEASTGIVTVAI